MSRVERIQERLKNIPVEVPGTWYHEDIPWLLAENARLEAELRRYKSYAARIEGLPDCNTCADKNNCTKCPAPGESTRINCPLWRGAQPDTGAEESDT